MKTLSVFDRLFIRMAGQDPETASRCGADEINRIRVRGRSLVIPVAFACIGGYALAAQHGAGLFLALASGLFWMTVVYLNDNAIMATGTGSSNVWPIILRIALAVTTSLIIGEALLLLMFKDVIRQQLDDDLKEDLAIVVSIYQPREEALYSELLDAKVELRQKEDRFSAELDGTGGSGKRGYDVIARKKETLMLAERQRYASDTARILQSLRALHSRRAAEYEQVKEEQASGAAGALGALYRIPHWYIQAATWIVRLALLLLDLIPVMIKYSSHKASDQYEKLVRMEAEHLHDMALLEHTMNREVMKEKMGYVSTEARIKADYDHRLEELDMYDTFMRASAQRWGREKTFHAKEVSPEFTESKASEEMRKAFETLWHSTLEPTV